MRRFFLTVTLAAAAVIILASEYRRETVTPPTDKGAVAPVAAIAPAIPEAKVAVKTQPETVVTAVPAKREAATASGQTSAATPAKTQPSQQAAAPAAAAPPPSQAEGVSYGAAHTTSSVSANATEEEFARLPLVDLKSAVQRELARLGCYRAKVDGLWGRKSMAAVRSFNARSGANLNAWPSPRLARVLSAAPDGACKSGIAMGKGGGKGADTAHVPAWMREARLAGTDPRAASTDAVTSPRKTAKARDRSRVAKQRRRERIAYRSASNWTPKDWPGTAQ